MSAPSTDPTSGLGVSSGKAEPGPAPQAQLLEQLPIRNGELWMDDPDHNWNKACLEYFKAKYLQRLQKSHWANEPFNQLFEVPADPTNARYPLPEAVEDDGIMRNLLNDRLFYLAFFCMRYGAGSVNSYEWFLWEMFGTNPGCLLELCFAARSHSPVTEPGCSFVEGYLDSITLAKPETFESFLSDIESCLAKLSLVPSFKSTLEKLKERLSELRQDLANYGLAAAWSLHRVEEISEPLGVLTTEYPLYTGLKQYLQINEEGILKSVLEHSLKQLPPFPDPLIQINDTFSSLPFRPGQPVVASDPSDATLFFDTAGTGKTTAIQEKIQKGFGFYCLSPNLLPSDRRDMSSVITPDRACASRDTYSMYEDFKALGKLDLDSRRWQDFLRPRPTSICLALSSSEPLNAARYHLLKIFTEIEGRRMGNAKESQIKWLRLQISCWPGNDPFDAAYRFIRMQSDEEIDQKIDVRMTSQATLWAFDEAQQALSDPLASEMLADILWRNKSDGIHSLLSGTSLELQKMKNFLSDQRIFMDLDQKETVFGRKYQKAYVLDEDKFLEVIRVHAWNVVKELYALQNCNNCERNPKDFPLLSRGGRALGFTVQLPQGTWEEVETALQEWHIFKSDTTTATTTTAITTDTSTTITGTPTIPTTTTTTTHSLSSLTTSISTKTATNTSDTSKKTTKSTTDPPSPSIEPSKELTKFLNQVKRVHTMLLGRIRWTTLFAEELLRDSPAAEGKLTDQDINNATKRAADTIKQSLRERIDQFKHTHWVNELYWTAIEADVFSMTRIFSDEESAKLISEGFALVDEDWRKSIQEGGDAQQTQILKGRLQEPLAVKAVMEYLRDPGNGDLYDKLINRFFISLQFDRGQGGALGKMAEFVFTAKLDNFLRDTNDEIAKHRRQMFIDILKTAVGKSPDENETAGNKIGNIEEYYLIDMDRRLELDDKTNSQQWLKDRPSTFKFPSQNEGPDLLFFLEKPGRTPGTTSKILCAVQFKTGTTETADKPYIKHALHTLALKPWKRRKMEWCPVIHIYVANAVNISESNFQNCLASTPGDAEKKEWDRTKLRDNDFICYMDREHSKNVFGETFDALLALMKK